MPVLCPCLQIIKWANTYLPIPNTIFEDLLYASKLNTYHVTLVLVTIGMPEFKIAKKLPPHKGASLFYVDKILDIFDLPPCRQL